MASQTSFSSSYYNYMLEMMRNLDKATETLVENKPIEHKPPEKPPVTWDDVIGLEEAKEQLQEAVEAPFLHKEIYEAFNVIPPKGVLLYGPAGCGKTLIGKAVASAMAKVHNKKVFDGFFYFNGAEMFGPHVGCEEKWLRDAFEQAEDFYKKNGFPAVLFFDEADSMLPKREISPPWTRNAVNQFLSLMDGINDRTAFVMLATNNHLILDDAAIRAGRIDRKVYVGPPTKKAVQKIIEMNFMNKPVSEDFSEYVTNELYSESRFVGERQFSEFINGANAAAIPNSAASIAFNRALKNKLSGCDLVITKADVSKAIEVLFLEIKEFSKVMANIPKPNIDVTVNHKIQTDGTSQDLF